MPKPRMVKSDAYKKRPVVERWWRYKKHVLLLANQAGGIRVGEIIHELIFVLPIPDTFYNKDGTIKKQYRDVGVAEGAPHMTNKPDLDNLLKGFKDIFCKNDHHVHTYVSIKKVWGKSGQIIFLNDTQ